MPLVFDKPQTVLIRNGICPHSGCAGRVVRAMERAAPATLVYRCRTCWRWVLWQPELAVFEELRPGDYR